MVFLVSAHSFTCLIVHGLFGHSGFILWPLHVIRYYYQKLTYIACYSWRFVGRTHF